MTLKVVGGGTLDGVLGKQPDFSNISIPLGRVVISLDADDFVLYHVVEEINKGGSATANGLFANPTTTSTTAEVKSVQGRTGIVVLTKEDIGLGSVDNTSDLDKPISDATRAAIDLVSGGSSDGLLLLEDEIRKVRILALAGL